MEVAGMLSGGFPLIKSFQVSSAWTASTKAGIPVLTGASASGGGVTIGALGGAGAAAALGVTLDTAVYTATQGTGSASALRRIRVVINPDQIVRMRQCGGATSGTTLPTQTNTTLSSGGTLITTGAVWNGPTFLNGQVWGLTGNNVGALRKITTVSATAGTVVVPFDYAIAVNDTFLRSPVSPGSTVLAQLTTDLTELDATAAIAATAEYVCIDTELNSGLDSYAHFIFADHVLAN